MLMKKKEKPLEIQQGTQKEGRNPKGLHSTSFPDLFTLEKSLPLPKQSPVNFKAFLNYPISINFTKPTQLQL